MPTGYTRPLHAGEPITFQQFALRCARGMGAAILQRDESLDVEIRERQVEDYYAERVTQAHAELTEALALQPEDWVQLQDERIRASQKSHDDHVRDRDAMRARYDAMLKQVHAWAPPTEEHQGLKEFMVKQITESISFDCGDWEPAVEERKPVVLFAATTIARLSENVAQAAKQQMDEQERVRSQNSWLRALRDSLTTGKADAS